MHFKKEKRNMGSGSLNLLNYDNRYSETDRLREDLFEVLGDSLFYCKNMDELIFLSLKEIAPINKYLKNKPKLIEKRIEKILQHFKIKPILKALIKNYSTGEIINSNENYIKKTNKELFVKEILRLKEVPKYEYDRLSINSEEHLKNINNNIKYYDSQEFIIEFKKSKKTPSNHQERTLLDFYFRCIDEQQKILDYIYNGGLRHRAILLSTHFVVDVPLSFIFGLNDFPYYSSLSSNKGYFNHEFISKSAHRVGNFPISESYEMEKLYGQDKDRFYKKYFTRKTLKSVLDEIEYYISHLPISYDRKLIIKELVFLFSKKRWMSFYGLALSQIEGLFFEMIDFTSQKRGSNSLPNKVNIIRRYYNLSDAYLDYFEYHIPKLRNKFMHGVLDGYEKEKAYSYDLLTDIHFLLDMINNLDSPYISLNNILKKSNYILSNIEDVAFLFDLYEQLNPAQKNKVNGLLKKFVNENLIETNNLEFMVLGVSETIFEKTNLLKTIFFDSFEREIDIEKDNYKLLEIFFNNKANLELLKNAFQFYEYDLNKMISYNTFLKLHKKPIYKLPKSLITSIDVKFKDYKDLINKLSLLGKLISKTNN